MGRQSGSNNYLHTNPWSLSLRCKYKYKYKDCKDKLKDNKKNKNKDNENDCKAKAKDNENDCRYKDKDNDNDSTDKDKDIENDCNYKYKDNENDCKDKNNENDKNRDSYEDTDKESFSVKSSPLKYSWRDLSTQTCDKRTSSCIKLDRLSLGEGNIVWMKSVFLGRKCCLYFMKYS